MSNSRLRSLKFFFGFLSLILIIRLFNIQILQNRRYKTSADLQHFSERIVPANRGSIFSQDGFPLVVNKPSYLLFAEIPKIEDPAGTSKELSAILFDPDSYTDSERKIGLGNLKKNLENDLRAKMENPDLVWVALAKNLSTQLKDKIELLEIHGLGFDEGSARYYPEGFLGSYVLGFVGSAGGGEARGYYGLEGFYDGDLRGRTGKVIEEMSASGMPILSGDYREISVSNGRDLVLTVNRSVQYMVEKKLKGAVERYAAKSGTVIVLDPFSGSVISMASYPNFDAENWENFSKNFADETVDKNLIFRNPAVSETYEPGSVMKALTIAAAIDLDLVTPQSEFEDAGPITASGHLVDNWDKKHYGRQTIIQLLQKSNNIGAAYVGKKLGSEKLKSYFNRFGLGSLTGIDLAGEDTGLIKPLDQWREIDLVNAAFGQGVSVTSLQLVSAFAAIANGGTLYRPFIVSAIRDGDGLIPFKPLKMRQVLSVEKAEITSDLLTAAAEGGEGKFFVLKKYRVAGKTGTAQIPVEGHYDSEKTNATFVGFLPSSLKFVMLVRLREPTASIYAAETAVPLWMDITKDLVSFFAIAPDR